jgi:protein-disulfide isomerase
MTSSRSAREDRARRVAAARAQAERAQRRRRTAVLAGSVVAVLVVVVGVGILVQARRVENQRASATAAAVPGGTSGTTNQDVVVGQAHAPVTVTLYEDFQCPICRDFERQSGSTLRSLVDHGTVRLVYRPIAILDRFSTTRYSTRALSSVGCVLNTRPGAFPAYHDLLFARQPAENSAGLPDAELTRLAKQAGADVGPCVSAQRYAGWASRVTDQASKDGVQGTPTVEVNGTVLQDFSPQSLRAAVSAAAARR